MKGMKGKQVLILGVLFSFVFLIFGCGTVTTQSRKQVQQQPASGNEGPVNDRRFDGRWQSPDGQWELEFYADTYILFRYTTAGTENRVSNSGVFYYTNNEIDCQTEPGMHFVLGYSLNESMLTVVSAGPATPAFLVGQWKRIDTPDLGETNPLVGTWKGKTDNGYIICQFYSDGTGRDYDCTKELNNMNAVGYINYNINTSTFIEELVVRGGDKAFVDGTFSLNGDELKFGVFVLKRQ